MPKLKVPRKSTTVDMTAMCDVAFLLLSFFILATKQKPPEAMAVNIPSSISAKVAPDKAIIITLTKDGKTFLTLGDDTKKKEIIENVNLNKQLGLTPAEISKLSKQEFVGVPFGQLKSYLAMDPLPGAAQLPGIPVSDTANNQLTDWIRSITNVYAGTDKKELADMLLVKGDNEALYPSFKAIKEAFKKNEMWKFRIITNGTAVPVGSELYKNSAGVPAGKKE